MMDEPKSGLDPAAPDTLQPSDASVASSPVLEDRPADRPDSQDALPEDALAKSGGTRDKLERRVFLVLLVVMTLLFLYVLKPFFGPILWACVLAVMFKPLQKKLFGAMGNRPNLSSFVTLLIAVVICVVPLLFIIRSFYHQATDLYGMFQSGQIDIRKYIDAFNEKWPAIRDFLARFGFDPAAVSGQVTKALSSVGGFVASHAMQVVQGTARFFIGLFLMLYLSFFLLKDGGRLTGLVIKALPMGDRRERMVFARFTEMVRAMVKGTLVIACVQGLLGGLIFWILGIRGPVLWGVVMAVTSMIPVLGTWIVWLPFAVYLLITPLWYKGLILALFGIFVIGLIDNFLRPRLVGRETKVPDWVVLFSTLGGLVAFGINGFIIGPIVAALFLTFWDIFARDFS